MSDFICPYCEHEFEHDGDFENMDDHNRLTVGCPNCDNNFYSYVEFIPHFNEARKAPCENGELCEMETKDCGYDHIVFTVCKHCGYTKLTQKEST